MTQQPVRQAIERNLAMELVRVTEAAAMAASIHMGKGDKELVDQAAVDAMRFTLQGIAMEGIVVIGEGEKDEAPMLYNGEVIGNGPEPKLDIAVDPIDGTTLLSKGLPGAIAVIAMSDRGSMNVPVGLLHGQDLRRSAGQGRYRHQPLEDGKPAAHRQGARQADRRSHRHRARPAPPR